MIPSPQALVLLFLLLPLLLWPPALARSEKGPPPAQWTAQAAVEFALVHSPDASVAQQRIRAAEADRRLARAAFYPQLVLSSEYSRTNNPMQSFGNILNQGTFSQSIDFNDPGLTDALQTRAALQYRLYNGGHDQAAVEAADRRGQASRQEQTAIRAQLGFEVVRAFYTIVQAGDTVQARKTALETIAASLKVARARYRQGTLLEQDLLNLEVEQSRAQEGLIQAEHGLSLAQRGFLHLLGVDAGTVRVDVVASQEQEIPVERDFRARPELAAMAALVKAREAMVTQAGAGRLPTADAFGSYQLDRGTEPEDGSGNSWTAGLRVNYTLANGGQTAAAVDRAQAQLTEAREQQRKLELACSLEVDQAALALHREEERLKVTARMVAAASESQRLARIRFQEGVLLASDLIESQNRLTEARVSQALAASARKIAIADLRRAVGLAQFNQGKLP